MARFEKGHEKIGGRVAGSKNKVKLPTIWDKINEKYPGFDPMMALADFIHDPTTIEIDKVNACRTMIPYKYAKPKPVDTSTAPADIPWHDRVAAVSEIFERLSDGDLTEERAKDLMLLMHLGTQLERLTTAGKRVTSVELDLMVKKNA